MRQGFLSDRRGTIAVVFALSLIPVLGFLGVAVDYSRASSARAYEQSVLDSAALAAATYDYASAPQMVIQQVQSQFQQKGGLSNVDLQVQANWQNATDIHVTATLQLPMTILQAVPGMPATIPVTASSTAQIYKTEDITNYAPISQLDPEAGDYNRIYLYCFNSSASKSAYAATKSQTAVKYTTSGGVKMVGSTDPAVLSDRTRYEAATFVSAPTYQTDAARTQMTPVADNAGTVYNYPVPDCNPKIGEVLSYRLHNVRNSRANSGSWNNTNCDSSGCGTQGKNGVYEYYTDTKINNSTKVEEYSVNLPPNAQDGLVETIMCQNMNECKPKSQGGILPNNHETDRSPSVTKEACGPGKYLYMGWEDRPPLSDGNGGYYNSDKDYDDIRLIIPCPTVIRGTPQVRLIQ